VLGVGVVCKYKYIDEEEEQDDEAEHDDDAFTI